MRSVLTLCISRVFICRRFSLFRLYKSFNSNNNINITHMKQNSVLHAFLHLTSNFKRANNTTYFPPYILYSLTFDFEIDLVI